MMRCDCCGEDGADPTNHKHFSCTQEFYRRIDNNICVACNKPLVHTPICHDACGDMSPFEGYSPEFNA